METKIRMTEAIWSALRRYHLDPAIRRERISYVFGTAVRLPNELVIVLTDAPILLGDDCYIAQSGGHVSLDTGVQNVVFAQFARSNHDVCVNVHDHHFSRGRTTFSPTDTRDELQLDEYFRRRFEPMLVRKPEFGRPRNVINVALVLDQAGCDARYLDGDSHFKQIACIDVIGEKPARILPNSTVRDADAIDHRFQRHTDFMPADSQRYIAEAGFAIIGCGGLGSIAGEALVRLGARRIVLIDHDRLEVHNLNRWQSGTPQDVGRYKASVLAERLQVFAGDENADIRAVPKSAFDREGDEALKSADVIIGALDTHVARYFLNRFAVQYCVPYFDAGVSIQAGDNVDFQSRYVAVIPGATACMECSAYTLIDRAEVERALMDDVTTAARRSAGYVDGKPEIAAAASAYALNMRATATLIMELQNWICGFRPLATCTMERWRDGHIQRSDRETHHETPDPNCPSCGNLLGAVDRAELPRPRAEGHVARLLEQARGDLRARLTRPSMEAQNGQVRTESH